MPARPDAGQSEEESKGSLIKCVILTFDKKSVRFGAVLWPLATGLDGWELKANGPHLSFRALTWRKECDRRCVLNAHRC